MNSAYAYVLITLMIICMDISSAVQQCLSERKESVKFSIMSRRNHTGHWNAQINLEHAAGEANNADQDRGPWEVDLEQTSKLCNRTEIVRLAASVSAPPSKAGPNYEFIPGMGYYKLHTTTKSWLEARDTCAEEGAHLAIINSEKELKAVQGIFQLHPKIRDGWENNVAYIGFHDLFIEGQYMTIFGDPLASTGYSTFASGQPTDRNGSTGEDCGSLERINTGLHDVGCNQLMPFFCEQEIF